MFKLTGWLNNKFRKPVSLAVCFTSLFATAQKQEPLSLEKAYQLARNNYPLIRQQELIAKTASINIENLRKGFLPQINFSAQASYQSAVTEVKIPVPGFTVDPLSKDQYRIVADINQTLYDGGVYREQKKIQTLNAAAESQRVEVDLYKIRERINQLFLGVLFVDEQLKQTELIEADISNGIKKVEAQVNNGVAFRSNLNVLQAELLKTEQRVIELKASREGLLQALGLFINQQLPANQQLQMPAESNVEITAPINRPEIKLFSLQDQLLAGQINLIRARNIPKASLFAQTGYAKPALNFLKNEFDLYYVAGVRLNWSLGGLYTKKREKELIELNRQSVTIQKETFLLNTNASLVQQQSELNKLQQLISSDKQIIDLRIKVKDAAKAQLENGVITANDYLREINAEDQARQGLITHQLQLLQVQISYKNISGNQ